MAYDVGGDVDRAVDDAFEVDEAAVGRRRARGRMLEHDVMAAEFGR
jgi:hypothetical protein